MKLIVGQLEWRIERRRALLKSIFGFGMQFGNEIQRVTLGGWGGRLTSIIYKGWVSRRIVGWATINVGWKLHRYAKAYANCFVLLISVSCGCLNLWAVEHVFRSIGCLWSQSNGSYYIPNGYVYLCILQLCNNWWPFTTSLLHWTFNNFSASLCTVIYEYIYLCLI